MRCVICVLVLLFSSGCFYKPITNITASAPQLAAVKPEFGDDNLGAQQPNYDVADTIRFTPKGTSIGVLDHTFGDSLSVISSLLSGISPKFFRVHFINTTCLHGIHPCGSYELTHGYTASTFDAAVRAKKKSIIQPYQARVVAYCNFMPKFPSTTFVGSPALEHQLSKQGWEILADAALAVCPKLQLDNNAMVGPGERYRGAWLEAHGSKPGPGYEIISTDGAEIMDVDSALWASLGTGSKIKFRWSRINNGTDNGTWKDPRSRTNFGTGPEIEQQTHVTDQVGSPPKLSTPCSVIPMDSRTIWKPLSEDHGDGDRRSNLPVLIASLTGSAPITLTTFKGSSVGSLGYYGRFTDSRNRFYSGYNGGSGKTGYQFQKQAVALSGSPYVWAKQGNTCIGPFVPGRRQGNYRVNALRVHKKVSRSKTTLHKL